MTRIAGIFAGISLSLAAILPAAAQPAVGAAGPATLLGAFNNWQAYSTGSGANMTC
jgi:hypothetical protein